MPTKELTERQRKFCRAYLKTLNATQAAIDAGYAEGGNEGSCAVIGYENLRKLNIIKYIEKQLDKQAEKEGVSIGYVLRKLKREAEYDSFGSSHSARVNALFHLGKHLAMFTDKIKVELGLKGLLKEIEDEGERGLPKTKA